MLNKIILPAILAALAVLLMPARVSAYGAAHVGYTHVGPNGVYHAGRTAVAGPGGVYAGGRTTAVGAGGGYYHAGYAGGAGYGGARVGYGTAGGYGYSAG